MLDDSDDLVESSDLPPDGDLAALLRGWPSPDVVGHRIVHGGTQFNSAVRLDEQVIAQLRALIDLAPLHQPKSLDALDAVSGVLPEVPAVACFDTAFHQTMPSAAHTYAVPAEWRDRYGVRRYGFHGLSHAYASRRAVELAGGGSRVVTCHLGAGASLCAVLDGRSVDTTMGFTPLEGLVMATRSGTVDPGLVLWLEEHERMTPNEVATALERQSGMLALASTADLREVEERAERGDKDARLAMDVYLHRLVGGIAAMAASLGGLDVVVFTGGVGEHSPAVRSAAAERLGWLGMRIDAEANAAANGDAVVTAAGARVACLVVAAREDLQIAHETRQLLA
ncbi:MAG TPA: acetate/propionate family kinase [Jatrophihabitans sp.]|nr:acetate/propionate family kinase [Jatrophihabitans sp.]